MKMKIIIITILFILSLFIFFKIVNSEIDSLNGKIDNKNYIKYSLEKYISTSNEIKNKNNNNNDPNNIIFPIHPITIDFSKYNFIFVYETWILFGIYLFIMNLIIRQKDKIKGLEDNNLNKKFDKITNDFLEFLETKTDIHTFKEKYESHLRICVEIFTQKDLNIPDILKENITIENNKLYIKETLINLNKQKEKNSIIKSRIKEIDESYQISKCPDALKERYLKSSDEYKKSLINDKWIYLLFSFFLMIMSITAFIFLENILVLIFPNLMSSYFIGFFFSMVTEISKNEKIVCDFKRNYNNTNKPKIQKTLLDNFKKYIETEIQTNNNFRFFNQIIDLLKTIIKK